MKAIKNLILGAAILISGSAYALVQDTLMIKPQALVDSLNHSPYAPGDSATFGIWVYNLGADSVVGFAFAYSTGTNTVYYTDSTPQTTGMYSGISSLGPHDSLSVLIHAHFTTPDFINGSSVVVIWPVIVANPGIVLVTDSSSTTVSIHPNGILAIDPQMPQVYMSGQDLIVRQAAENMSGDIRIYDLTGRLVSGQNLAPYNNIPMQPYSEGVYVVDIALSDGRHAVCKVLNMK